MEIRRICFYFKLSNLKLTGVAYRIITLLVIYNVTSYVRYFTIKLQTFINLKLVSQHNYIDREFTCVAVYPIERILEAVVLFHNIISITK